MNNLTRPYIEGFAPAANGRGILDFTVTEASRPEAQVNGNALKEDPGLSLLRPAVINIAAAYGQDPATVAAAASYLGLVSASAGMT